MQAEIFILGILILAILLLIVMGKNRKHEKFVEGESVYMEPEYNYYFSKCLQSYPIAFRGPINDGWYSCARKTEELLKNLGQGCRGNQKNKMCEFCYNKC